MRSATSQRTRNRTRPGTPAPAAPAPAAPAPDLIPGRSDLLRRTLLVLVVALLVARPVVAGEDPGLRSDLSEPAGAVLTLVTLVTAAAWAAWRLLVRRTALAAGWAEVGMALFVGAAFVAVSATGYAPRPAWLCAWEWVGVAVLFVLIRDLASGPDERQGLYAALLAGGVALAAQVGYEAAYEIPRTARLVAEKPSTLPGTASRLGVATEDERDRLERRLTERLPAGPFWHPVACGAAGAAAPGSRRRGGGVRAGGTPGWLTAAAGLLALGGAAALVLTRQGEAVAALLLANLLVLALAWRQLSGRERAVRAGGFALLAAGAAGLGYAEVLTWTAFPWRASWPVVWRVITDNVWAGVGWENFAPLFGKYLYPVIGPAAGSPGNWLLEAWVGGGVASVVGLLVLLGAVARRVVWPQTPAAAAPGEGDGSPVRWEFYLGGTVGLVMSFLLRAGVVPADTLLTETAAAAVRVVAWFAAYAVLERVPWTDGEQRLTLAGGALGLLLLLSMAGSLAWVSLVTPLAAVLALTLAVSSSPAPAHPGALLPRLGPLPVLGGAALAFFALVLYPTASALSATARALAAGQSYFDDAQRSEDDRKLAAPAKYIQEKVIAPLRDAERDDPDNARTRIHLAGWYARLWTPLDPDEGRPGRVARTTLEYASRAQGLDPASAEGWVAEATLRERFAGVLTRWVKKLEGEAADRQNPLKPPEREQRRQVAERLRKEAAEQRRLAAEALAGAVARVPGDARLRSLQAASLFEAGQAEAGRAAAREAVRIDDLAARAGMRRLADPQRRQLETWLGGDGGS